MPIRRHQRKPENYGVGARDGEPQLIFPPVLKSDHTMLVVQGRLASTQRRRPIFLSAASHAHTA
jgi:hypothetical protein